MSLPDIASLPALPEEALTGTLDLLFEPSLTLHALAVPTLRSTPYASYESLIGAVRERLLALAAYDETESSGRQQRENLHAILGSHPRLGEPKTHTLSAQSAAEQRRLQEEGGAETAARLQTLNAEYEAAFPGLRYVVFVNGRGRPEIMADMRRRIDRGDAREEEREAIRAMCDIASDRVRKLESLKA